MAESENVYRGLDEHAVSLNRSAKPAAVSWRFSLKPAKLYTTVNGVFSRDTLQNGTNSLWMFTWVRLVVAAEACVTSTRNSPLSLKTKSLVGVPSQAPSMPLATWHSSVGTRMRTLRDRPYTRSTMLICVSALVTLYSFSPTRSNT